MGVCMNELTEKSCVACQRGTKALAGGDLVALQRQLGRSWRVIEGHHLEKEFKFDDFRQALSFTNRVGELAEQEGHHPDIYLSWGKVRITLWTHKVDGLTENDFILAAKIQEL
jgi:4a-hydroxytetrahydrobiopterin dehydratase